jgi:hypothetical protein
MDMAGAAIDGTPARGALEPAWRTSLEVLDSV